MLKERLQRDIANGLLFSLNPYFNGTCSKRGHFFVRSYVLIRYVAIFTLINAFVSEKCTCFLFKTLQR